MAGYTPLFGSIVRSSIWDEDNATRVVWITMLALADKDGFIEGSTKGLAHEARVSIRECSTAIEILKAPDPHSKTIDNEGRRIKEVESGWVILNYSLYRKKAKSRAGYYRNYRKLKKEEESNKEEEKTNTNAYANRRNSAQHAQHVARTNEITIFTQEDFINSGSKVGLSEAESKECYDYYKGLNFEIKKDYPIRDPADACVRFRNNRHRFKKPNKESVKERLKRL